MVSTRFAVLAGATVLAGCAARREDSCQPRHVPTDATIVATHGVDFAVHPYPLPESYSGCQTSWVGDGNARESMQWLSTAKYLDCRVQWLSRREPKGVESRCVHRGRRLVPEESVHPEGCPTADELERV
jgi:hypothetical protein